MRKYRIQYVNRGFRIDVNVNNSSNYPVWSFESFHDKEEDAVTYIKQLVAMDEKYKNGPIYYDERGQQAS